MPPKLTEKPIGKSRRVVMPDGYIRVDINETFETFGKFISDKVVSIFFIDGSTDTILYGRGFKINQFEKAVGFKVTEHESSNINQNSHQDIDPEEIYNHPLYGIFIKAIEQAIRGKGERHGGGTIPFMEQPWTHKAKTHGRGFLTGQASKKIDEAAETRQGLAFETEVLGAINYAAMSIIFENLNKGGEE